MEGAHRRYGEHLTEEQEERLRFELHIMKTMGFPGYFLIVQDFIRAAREELDVSVGPGRGSAAGSAVAYCLGITQIDPIAYDLLFERFLNPDRISLPDIDVDFDDDGRGRVLNWVTQKYGKEKVAHIITYGTMATKAAIKDVARVQKLMLSESDRLCKLVPDKIPDKKLNLQNAIDYVPGSRRPSSRTTPCCATRYAMPRCSRATSAIRAFTPAARSSAATTSPTGSPSRRPTTRRPARRCSSRSTKAR